MYDLINLDLEKMNIMSILERHDLICDNFYLFPAYYLDNFYKILLDLKKQKTIKCCLHTIKDDIQKNIEINYIYNEKKELPLKVYEEILAAERENILLNLWKHLKCKKHAKVFFNLPSI